MSILTFGLGVAGGGSTSFGTNVDVELETTPDNYIELAEGVNVTVEPIEEATVETGTGVIVETEPDKDLNIDVSCPQE